MILFHYIPNTIVWLVVFFSIGFIGFKRALKILLSRSPFVINRNNRRQVIRSLWQISFLFASSFFFYVYQQNVLWPKLDFIHRHDIGGDSSISHHLRKHNQYTFIFHKSNECKMQHSFYRLLIQSFHIHRALLELMYPTLINVIQEISYVSLLIILNVNGYENYFVSLNLLLGIYGVANEILSILILHNVKQSSTVCRVYAILHMAIWSHIFINILPFQYLMPSLASNFILAMKLNLLWWYIVNVWNSPLLRYGYHYLYHHSQSKDTVDQECLGHGLAARCVLLQDSREQRHLDFLREAYHLVRSAHARLYSHSYDVWRSQQEEESDAISKQKSLQTLKCILLLKRKAKRFREMKQRQNSLAKVSEENQENENENEEKKVVEEGNEMLDASEDVMEQSESSSDNIKDSNEK